MMIRSRTPRLSEPVIEPIAAAAVTMIEPELTWLTIFDRTPRVRPNMGLPFSESSMAFSRISRDISLPACMLSSVMMRITSTQPMLSTFVLIL